MRNQQKGDHETNEFQLAIACAALVLGCILLAPSQRWQEHKLVTDERIWIYVTTW